MFQPLYAWLNRRLGLDDFRAKASAELAKPVPAHVNWTFSLGTAAMTLLGIMVATGLLLMIYYKPDDRAAHDSVSFIMRRVHFGWLLRSLHAWCADFLVAVLFLHLVRVFCYAGYKRPRELTWLFGIGLLVCVLGMGLTGYLLPWTQLSYWATTVVTEMGTAPPAVGPLLVKALRGGDAVTGLTLGRFFVLHVALIPLAIGLLVAGHLYLVRRLGISTLLDADEEERRGYRTTVDAAGTRFWPDHVLVEARVQAVILGLLVTCAVLWPRGLGPRAAPLDATPEGIKPEWYFLPVYQVMKYFQFDLGPIDRRLIAFTFVNLAILAFALLPFWDRSPGRRPGCRKRALTIGALVLAAVVALGVLGHLSETDVTLFGTTYHVDIFGVPHRVPATVLPRGDG